MTITAERRFYPQKWGKQAPKMSRLGVFIGSIFTNI